MPWARDSDGLKSVGDCHYDVGEIRLLIEKLRLARNQPGMVCSLLEDLLSTGKATRKLIWHLSKWCDWRDSSHLTARAIASELFHNNICRRLLDKANKPIPDRATAEADYEKWLETTVQAGQGLPPSAVHPDEVDQAEPHFEGALHRVWVNKYERDQAARGERLAHYGSKCVVCGFEFGEAYDGMVTGYIHVHHLKKLSEIGREYSVDPIADLRPVCPNCHAVIHLNKQPFTIEDVQAMVKRSRARQTLATS